MSRTILVADDSVTIQRAVAIALAHEPSLSLVSVNNGRDAVMQARQLRPALVLADHVMPDGSGYEVAEALRTDGIPVMMMAGGSAPFDEARALAAGCIGHVNKPFDCQTMAERVMAALGASAGAPAPQTTPAPATLSQMPAVNPSPMAGAAMPPPIPTPAPAPQAAPPVQASAMPPDFGATPAPAAAPASMAPDFAASPSPFGGAAAPFGAPAAPPMTHESFGATPAPSAAPTFGDAAFDANSQSARAVTFPPQPAGDPLPPAFTPQATPAFTPQATPAFTPHATPAFTPQAAPAAPLRPAPAENPPTIPPPRPQVATMPAMEAVDFNTESALPTSPDASTPSFAASYDSPSDVHNASVMQNIAEAAASSVTAAVSAETAGAAPSAETLSAATREVIERVVWEVVPELAETLIREEISRLLAERQR